MRRRSLLLGGGAAIAAGCTAAPTPTWAGGWVGASAGRGHRLRQSLPGPGQGPLRRAEVIVVGAGVSGLACARALLAAGIDDIALLELEDEAGGNARGHRMGGIDCPLGAHYLPLPGPQSHEVQQLLEEFGLCRQQLGRWVFDERHLCHSPQERLFIDGAWQEGLLPRPERPDTLAQYRRFAARVGQAMRELGFAMPTQRAPWRAGHAALDAQSFAQWLDAEGLHDARLRWYLDYCCRDDYGASTATVSAWAGLHYFASRHGFHAPGDETAEREPVLTWPEGNAWLSRRLAAPLGARLRPGRTVLRVSAGRHAVELLAWNEQTDAPERWSAAQLVLATPLAVAARLLDPAPTALAAAVAGLRQAPWLVANLELDGPLLQRLGAAPAWDNVSYGGAALGYVDAMHQSTRSHAGPTVLSLYWALAEAQRAELLGAPWRLWAERSVAELARTHPDLHQQLRRVDLMRWGHAMSIPVPGRRSSAALAALRTPQGRLHFAHADLSAYSVFEEAFTLGDVLGRRLGTALRRAR